MLDLRSWGQAAMLRQPTCAPQHLAQHQLLSGAQGMPSKPTRTLRVQDRTRFYVILSGGLNLLLFHITPQALSQAQKAPVCVSRCHRIKVCKDK